MGLPLESSEVAARTDLRLRAAHPADMLHISELINGFAARGLMLPRVPEQIARHFREFVVVTDADGHLLGCAALRVYTAQLAELVALAVAPEAQGRGVGRMLVERIEEEARAIGVGTVFALTLQELFFHRLGYRTVPRELFPLKVWADCRTCPTQDACEEIAVVRELR
jgi:amino-acid N-acetyltransferase